MKKTVLFPVILMSSLALVTGCNDSGSSSKDKTKKEDITKPDGTKPDGTKPDGTKPDGTKPVGIYAENNKDVCVLDQKEINEIFKVTEDLIISDGCLKKGGEPKLLTDVNHTMMVDYSEASVMKILEPRFKEIYEEEDFEASGVSYEDFKKQLKTEITYFDMNGKLTFKSSAKQPSYDVELIKPKNAGVYEGIQRRTKITGTVNGKEVKEILEGFAFDLEVK